jgi:acyl carrier protein
MHANEGLVDEVREVMATVFGVAESELPEDVAQESYSRWTSLYHMTLLVSIEDRFATALSMNEMMSMTSLSAIIAVLAGHGVDNERQ